MGKYILIGLAVVLLEWVWVSFFPTFFTGLSMEGAAVLGAGFFLAFELVICTGLILRKLDKR